MIAVPEKAAELSPDSRRSRSTRPARQSGQSRPTEVGAKSLSDREIDQALIERVQRGDKGAFDLLVLKYQHRITHLVGRYVHDMHEAQDVTQEAFIKAYRGLKNFRGDSAFYTWLYRIAINTSKNHLVTRSRKISDTGIDAADAEQFDTGSALRENATPDRELVTAEIAETVRRSIEALPEDLRTAIVLREFEGMSYDEIAVAMECPIGTVRSRIFRAREAIDKNLEPLLDDTRG
jgi:RNA polymerase sigma-70 factor (ECF subfamily)